MDIHEHRRQRLQALIDADESAKGNVAAYARNHNQDAARLRQVLNANYRGGRSFGELTARRLEDELGLEPMYFDAGFTGQQHIPRLSGVPGIDPEASLINDLSRSGQGSVTADPHASRAFSVRPITTYESLDELPRESTVLVTRIDVQLSAGSGRETWHIEEKEPLPFQADYIRRLDAKPRNLVAVKVVGDSMEDRLFDDDTVIVDKADTRVPANGKVFALVYAGEMLVKRLQRLPDGGLRIISDNPKYEPITVTPEHVDNVTVVGRVKYRSGMGDF